MISYAQNFEDVILMRALKHVENGLYIDIGAHHPVENSVSLAFYERGWRGIHIEPLPSMAAALRQARPDEQVIEAACTTQTGQISFSQFGDTGLGTGVPETAQLHTSAGWESDSVSVNTVALADVFASLKGRDIHWLKIDVEGMEGTTLESWGASDARPWIVVVESTVPFSSVENYEDWQPQLEQRDYVFVYFDGLNRFYVHSSQKDLCAAFGPGPNYFDDFSIVEASPFAKHLNAVRQSENHAAKAKIAALTAQRQVENEATKAEIAKLTAENRILQDQIEWRRTIPERLLFRLNGRPIRPVRRALFHKSGKPRGVFRAWVLDAEGNPKPKFRRWMESGAYKRLPGAIHQGGQQLTQAKRFGGGPGKNNPRVAVLAPVSPSGSTGGAERLYNGLTRILSERGGAVDLIKVPFDESSLETIKAGYDRFETMDLDAYDLVISTKAPSYCARHRNHVLYLVHTIRVFYDMFETAFPEANAEMLAARDWIQERDTAALACIERRYSIGEEVSRRLLDFNGLDATVLHPGLDICVDSATPVGDYFFMPGRLHRWKRVHLAIEAVKQSELPITLRISGTGEHEAEFRDLAAGDERIIFEGYVDDDRLEALYAGALGVVFCPVSEDYGYVTIEAFAHGKPVISCEDSGEPLQFVNHGETGFVVAPDAKAIRQAMETLWSDRKAAQRMGAQAVEVATRVSWDVVADELVRGPVKLPAGVKGADGARRLRVAVLDMQPIMPPVGGGRLRLLGLYHDLGEAFDVRYLGAFDWRGEQDRQVFLTPSLQETVLSLSDAHYAAADQAQTSAGGHATIDMLFGEQAHLSPSYMAEMAAAVDWADIVVFSHPWCAPLLSKDVLDGKLVVYDSQNMEFDLRSRLLDTEDKFQSHVVERVEAAERLVGSWADVVLACSSEDADRFAEHYGWGQSNIELVPNGVFVTDFDGYNPQKRSEARSRLGIPDTDVIAFFIGSNYGPNVEAAKEIMDRLAPECPDISFVIAGGVVAGLPKTWPENVRVIGLISDEERRDWLLASDLAINPMMSGSGTNIKMFEYAAASMPIVSTPTGARGIVQTSSHGITVCDTTEMAGVLQLLSRDRARIKEEGAAAREFVSAHFSWELLSRDLGRLFLAEHLRHRGRETLTQARADGTKTVHISTVGHKCGIGEYTRHLIDFMDEKGFSSAVFTSRTPSTEPDLAGFEHRAAVAWFQDDETYRDSMLEEDFDGLLASAQANFAILQHHPGFLPPDQVLRLAAAAHAHNVKLAVVMHSYTEGQAELLKELNRMNVPVFSHKKRDTIEASGQGDLLLHVPLAIPTPGRAPERSAPHDASAPVIASNGFLRAHKGVPALVDAFAIVRKTIPDARLKLFCSLYPSSDSAKARQDVETQIAHLGLDDAVEFDVAYHEKDALLAKLASADVAVYPYSASAEGGSASVADAIAVGLPVILSPSRIFEDIRHAARTSGTDPEAIAQALLDLLQSPDDYRRLAGRTRAYADRHSWNNVVETIFGALG